MKRIIAVLFFLIVLGDSYAQKLEWAITTEGGWSYGRCVRVSPDGNVIIAGQFGDTVDLYSLYKI